jgi:hypothetical protein
MAGVDTADLYLQKALSKHLNAMTPTMSIAWENTNFTPTNGIAHLETWLLPIKTEAITLGPAYWEEFSGIFQITCVYPAGRGTNDAKTKAAAIKTRFKRGTSFTYNILEVKIRAAYPESGHYSEDGSWYRIPLSIIYICYASNT